MGDIPWTELGVVLIFFASWAATEIYKGLRPDKPVDPRVINAAVSAVVGTLVGGLAQGIELPHLAVMVIVAFGNVLVAASTHRVGDALRAYKEDRIL